jgi:hypothetical protein
MEKRSVRLQSTSAGCLIHGIMGRVAGGVHERGDVAHNAQRLVAWLCQRLSGPVGVYRPVLFAPVVGGFEISPSVVSIGCLSSSGADLPSLY